MMKLFSSTLILLFLFACGQPQKAENNTSDSAVSPPSPPPPPPSPPSPPIAAAPPGMEKRNDTVPRKPAINPYEKANVEVKTFENNEGPAKGSWGYNIFIDKNQYITQPSIPSVPGNSGFSSEGSARKAGEFVAYKIKHNIMPPAVTPQELDSLGVLH